MAVGEVSLDVSLVTVVCLNVSLVAVACLDVCLDVSLVAVEVYQILQISERQSIEGRLAAAKVRWLQWHGGD